jgi:beta-lactam-binding protein with PASTA domain
LAAAHLRLGEVSERQADGTAGVVVDQLPRPGATADRDTAVHIWLAIPATMTMPDLADLTRLDAERRIAALGLAPGTTADEGSPKLPGTVLRQRPLAGEQVAAGAAVDLVLAAALPATATLPPAATPTATVTPPQPPPQPPQEPPAPPIRVPDVSGRSEAEAGAMLQAAGLRPGSVSKVAFRAASGTVVNQFPVAGTDVPPGTAVALGVADINLALLWMVGGVALGIAAAGVVSQVRRRRRKLPSSVAYAPHLDEGTQTIEVDRGVELPASELSLQGFPDGGVQSCTAL